MKWKMPNLRLFQMLLKKRKVIFKNIILVLPFVLLIALVINKSLAIWIFIPSIIILLFLYVAGGWIITGIIFTQEEIYDSPRLTLWLTTPFDYYVRTAQEQAAKQHYQRFAKESWKQGLTTVGFNPGSISLNDNSPKIIYKYRDWNNQYHKNLLLKQELFFCFTLGFQ